jgi:outer membrane biosynthesis protein TonB
MIKALGALLMSAALLVFLSGASLAQTTKPEHPSKTEHPKAAPAKTEHPKAEQSKPEHPKADPAKPEHPKAEPKPEHPKSEHPK